MKLYTNAEVEFKFLINNPIVQTGILKIYYPNDNTNQFNAAVSFDDSNAFLRCFDNTCVSTGSNTSTSLQHDSVGKFVKVTAAFQNPDVVRKRDAPYNIVRFSISGWTLPAPTASQTAV